MPNTNFRHVLTKYNFQIEKIKPVCNNFSIFAEVLTMKFVFRIFCLLFFLANVSLAQINDNDTQGAGFLSGPEVVSAVDKNKGLADIDNTKGFISQYGLTHMLAFVKDSRLGADSFLRLAGGPSLIFTFIDKKYNAHQLEAYSVFSYAEDTMHVQSELSYAYTVPIVQRTKKGNFFLFAGGGLRIWDIEKTPEAFYIPASITSTELFLTLGFKLRFVHNYINKITLNGKTALSVLGVANYEQVDFSDRYYASAPFAAGIYSGVHSSTQLSLDFLFGVSFGFSIEYAFKTNQYKFGAEHDYSSLQHFGMVRFLYRLYNPRKNMLME